MSREIKFRAWDIPGEFYFPVDTIAFLAGGIKANGPSYGERWATVNKGFEDYCDVTIILEQYTGLKDKNGVEIHEGDKVRLRHGTHGREHIGIITWSQEGCKFYAREPKMKQFGWSLDTQFIEVIGSIHDKEKP